MKDNAESSLKLLDNESLKSELKPVSHDNKRKRKTKSNVEEELVHQDANVCNETTVKSEPLIAVFNTDQSSTDGKKIAKRKKKKSTSVATRCDVSPTAEENFEKPVPKKAKRSRNNRRVIKIRELGINISNTDINLLLQPRKPVLGQPNLDKCICCPSCHAHINVRNKKRASSLVMDHVNQVHPYCTDTQSILASFEKALYQMTYKYNCPQSSDPPPLVCPLCGETRSGGVSFERHMTMCHSNQENISGLCEQTKKQHQLEQWKSKYTRQKSKVKACEFCGKEYETYTSLKYHIQHVCRANPKRTKRSDSKPYICEHCGKGFIAGRYLYLHQVTTHDKVTSKKYAREYKVYSCSICNQKFLSQFKLNRHLASHTGQKSAIVCLDVSVHCLQHVGN